MQGGASKRVCCQSGIASVVSRTIFPPPLAPSSSRSFLLLLLLPPTLAPSPPLAPSSSSRSFLLLSLLPPLAPSSSRSCSLTHSRRSLAASPPPTPLGCRSAKKKAACADTPTRHATLHPLPAPFKTARRLPLPDKAVSRYPTRPSPVTRMARDRPRPETDRDRPGSSVASGDSPEACGLQPL